MNIKLFTEEEIEYFLARGKETVYKKGDFFIQEGDVARKIGFIKEGILRSFYFSSNSDDVTYCFSFPNELIAGYSSLITQEKTKENIQALTDCKIIEFPKSILDEMLEKSRNWLLFSKQIAEFHYVRLEERFFSFQKETALSRYLKLIERNPEYLQQIPLNYLASYLGVSQRHLSRLRKQIFY